MENVYIHFICSLIIRNLLNIRPIRMQFFVSHKTMYILPSAKSVCPRILELLAI